MSVQHILVCLNVSNVNRTDLGANPIVLQINIPMSDLELTSDISILKDVLSKVESTEKALNELAGVGLQGNAVNDKLEKLREFLSEAKDTLQDAAAGYDAQVIKDI